MSNNLYDEEKAEMEATTKDNVFSTLTMDICMKSISCRSAKEM